MNLVFRCVHGSHLYGLNTPDSDMDYKSVFIPPMRDFLTGSVRNIVESSTSGNNAKNTADDIDDTKISLRRFIELACAGETYAIDMLHATPEHTLITSGVWEYIQRHRDMFYSTNMSAYMGYVMRQASKYGVKGSRLAAMRQVYDVMSTVSDTKLEQVAPDARGVKVTPQRMSDLRYTLPENEFCYWVVDASGTYYRMMNRKYVIGLRVQDFRAAVLKLWDEYGERARKAEANEGICWKSLSHALRGSYQLQEILDTGNLVYPLKDRDVLMKVKQGLMPFKEVQQLLEETVSDVERKIEIAKRNGMRSTPNLEFWDNFVTQVYADEMRKYLN